MGSPPICGFNLWFILWCFSSRNHFMETFIEFITWFTIAPSFSGNIYWLSYMVSIAPSSSGSIRIYRLSLVLSRDFFHDEPHQKALNYTLFLMRFTSQTMYSMITMLNHHNRKISAETKLNLYIYHIMVFIKWFS